MTATNHALVGAVIALAVKRPELAVPFAFLSHFALDAIPHYNPPTTRAHDQEAGDKKWQKKLKNRPFIFIFLVDMHLLLALLIVLPLIHPTSVSPWTILFSMLAAISPDFVDGRFLIYKILHLNFKSPKGRNWFSYWHDWVQWMDRPWGIWTELIWAGLMAWAIIKLR